MRVSVGVGARVRVRFMVPSGVELAVMIADTVVAVKAGGRMN